MTRHHSLNALLKKSGSSLNEARLKDLVRGVAAAPEAEDPDAWIALVAARPSAELKARLHVLLAEARERADDGLGEADAAPARLAALRAELKRRKVDGLLVPRGDEHQGEYVARCSERLAWLTGFTGSAGLAVVLARKAALFVDGRYTLQARAQVDTKRYAVTPLAPEETTGWIAANLKKGGRLAYDPWLLTPTQITRYKDACRRAGGDLVPLDGNPVDAVWENRPPAPIAPVVAHPKRFAGQASADKRAALAKDLAAQGLDAQVIAAPDSIAWLLNVRGGDVPHTPLALSFALLCRTGAVDWFVDKRKLHPELGRHLGKGVRVQAPAALGPALDKLAAKKAKVRLDPAITPVWIAARLEHGGAVLDRGADLCQLPKARKNAAEVKGIRAAHRRDGAAVARFLAWLETETPGGRITELVAEEVLLQFRREGDLFRDLSFDTISGAGPNGAIVHYRATPATNRRLKAGSLYLVDSGGQYLDGTTDITRTVAIGKPTREMADRFTRVLKGHIAVARTVFPKGTTGAQLDPLARRALWAAGLDYDHGTGHGVGSYLGVHEGPQRISKAPSTVAMEPGMVVSNEPGYYKTGAYGIRIENLVLVTKAATPKGGERDVLAFETLTLAPIDRALVAADLLDGDELAWLNAYHARVWSEIGPTVDKQTRAWLKRATAPIRR